MSTWPALDYASWRDTGATLQLWSQIAGKVSVALAPWLNHGWHVALHVNAHGYGTGPIPSGDGVVEIDFDFVQQRLVLRSSEGPDRGFALEPMSVAAFHRRLLDELAAIDVAVRLSPMPNEVADPIPFADDETHRTYDAATALAFWRALLQVDRVFRRFRTSFLGKASPVHLWWGSFDHAVTRFSGRAAPPRTAGSIRRASRPSAPRTARCGPRRSLRATDRRSCRTRPRARPRCPARSPRCSPRANRPRA